MSHIYGGTRPQWVNLPMYCSSLSCFTDIVSLPQSHRSNPEGYEYNLLVAHHNKTHPSASLISMVSCQKGPTHHAYASCQKGPTHHAYTWQIGPFWQDALDILSLRCAAHFATVRAQSDLDLSHWGQVTYIWHWTRSSLFNSLRPSDKFMQQ